MKKVLVIDKDSDSRASITEMLSDLSFTVFSVGNNEDGLRFLDRNPQLVFLDLQTSRLGINTFLEAMHTEIPKAQSILMSEECHAQEMARYGIKHFLEKPFRTHLFLNVLDECMRVLASAESRMSAAASTELEQNDSPLLKLSDLEALSLLVVSPAPYTDEISRAVKGTGWNLKTIKVVDEMRLHNPLYVGCLLLDSTHKPLVDEVLNWCEQASDWHSVPKLLVTPRQMEIDNLVSIPWNAVQQHLTSHSETVQKAPADADPSDRRKNYRHKCEWTLNINQTTKLLDLSASGASIEMPFAIPKGTHLSIPISSTDPLLRTVDAIVVSSRWRASTYIVHLSFTDITTAKERALQRLILALQIN